MKTNIILFQTFIFICLINSILNKSKKKKHKKDSKPKLPNGLPTPESVRPNYITPELFCETCRAIVKEAVKELKSKTRESDVMYYLDTACNDENRYTVYQHTPRDIKIGCGVFKGIYEDELVKLLTKRKADETKEQLIKQFCDETTEVCKGVEVDLFKHMQKIDKNTKINGEDVNIEFHSTKNETRKKKIYHYPLKMRMKKKKKIIKKRIKG